MPDDLNNGVAQNAALIDIYKANELRYWTKHFGITEQQLRDAVAQAGVSVSAVAAHLAR